MKGSPMAAKNLSISEARRQLSRLVAGVSRGGATITISQHGKEQATLLGIREYRELSQKAKAFEESQQRVKPFALKGSLELCCSLTELEAEMRKVRSLWGESVCRSSGELARKITRK